MRLISRIHKKTPTNQQQQNNLIEKRAKDLKSERKKVKSLSRIWLFAPPWSVAHQTPLSMEFSKQEYWSGLPFPSPRDLPDPGTEPGSPAMQASLPSEPPRKPTKDLDISPNKVSTWPISTLKCASVQFSSVAQSCLTLCDPMNRSTPGLPVHH